MNLVWYNSLNHPPLTPPAFVFAPAWAFLYALILFSFIIFIIKRSDKPKLWGYTLFIVQICLNLIWTPVFFGLHNIAAALAVIIILDVVVLFNIIEFFKISSGAAYLLIPYLCWLCYATYLNFGVLFLN